MKDFTVRELGRLLHGRELSALELTKIYLDRIAKTDAVIESFITV